MKKEEATQEVGGETVVPDYSVVSGLSKTPIAQIASRLSVLSAQKEEIELEMKELRAQGAGILAKASVKSVMVGELRVTRVDGQGASKIDGAVLLKAKGVTFEQVAKAATAFDKKRLFELGVSEKVIAKATVPGAPYTSLKVTAKKEESSQQ